MPVDQFSLIASDPSAGAQFGASTAVDGTTAIVGAPFANAAYIFVRSGGVWDEQAKLEPSDGLGGDFGTSVDISGDTAVVGAPQQVASGAVYIFLRVAGNWVQQAKVTADDGTPFDAFGNALAVHDDTLVAGAPDTGQGPGAAYAFTRNGVNWSQQDKLVPSYRT